jgi:hypothetical protein
MKLSFIVLVQIIVVVVMHFGIQKANELKIVCIHYVNFQGKFILLFTGSAAIAERSVPIEEGTCEKKISS